MNVEKWLKDRIENTHRIAGQKTGADRAGWLEDASYLEAALARVELVDELRRKSEANADHARLANENQASMARALEAANKRLSDAKFKCPDHGEWSSYIDRGCPLCLADLRDRAEKAEAEASRTHAEVRRDYDKTVADAWRAEVAKRDAYAERLAKVAELVYQWGDMMLDGPDDSDVAMANGWLQEAFTFAREIRRERGGPLVKVGRPGTNTLERRTSNES